MQIHTDKLRNYDVGLLVTAIVAVVLFISLFLNISPNSSQPSHYSQLKYRFASPDELNFENVDQVPSNQWMPAASPVNLGMSDKAVWFSMVIEPTQSPDSCLLYTSPSPRDS